MPAIFFQKYPGDGGESAQTEAPGALNGGAIPAGCNDTTVLLITNAKDPQCVKDLRPINLCNVLYRIISKVIANRLKVFLDDVIAPNQTCLSPGD